jgi:hypothetical protein
MRRTQCCRHTSWENTTHAGKTPLQQVNPKPPLALMRFSRKRNSMKYFLAILICLSSPLQLFAWSEQGHRIIAVMAFDMLGAADHQYVLKILESHPNYGKDFSLPKNAKNAQHWLIGAAGYWPDTARATASRQHSTAQKRAWESAHRHSTLLKSTAK